MGGYFRSARPGDLKCARVAAGLDPYVRPRKLLSVLEARMGDVAMAWA
jgi:hypothetical protein